MSKEQILRAQEGWKDFMLTEDDMKLLKIELENHAQAFNTAVGKLANGGARVEFEVIDSSGIMSETRPFIHGIKVMRQI